MQSCSGVDTAFAMTLRRRILPSSRIARSTANQKVGPASLQARRSGQSDWDCPLTNLFEKQAVGELAAFNWIDKSASIERSSGEAF